MEGSREKGRPTVRWVDSMKGSIGMSLQELIRASEDRAFWTSLLLGWPGVQAYLMACNTHNSNGSLGN